MTDIQFPPGSGTLDVTVKDNNGGPSTVLEADKDFTIEAAWSIDEYSAGVLGGRWELAAYVESIGPGPEWKVGETKRVELDGRTSYEAVITVPAGTLPDNPAPPRSGVYKLVTVLTHRMLDKVTEVAAFFEGPMLRIG